jgi:hypothetical protein
MPSIGLQTKGKKRQIRSHRPAGAIEQKTQKKKKKGFQSIQRAKDEALAIVMKDAKLYTTKSCLRVRSIFFEGIQKKKI